jgi:dolichol-phosphate mannosyltransferase
MKLSVVVSVFNEEAVLGAFWTELSRVLGEASFESEVIFVNDGSRDGSLALLRTLATANPGVKVVNLSRNFGHEAAMAAGLDHAGGDAVICMDADLQHPPAMLPAMVARFAKGDEVVTMARSDSEGVGLLPRLQSRLFYRLLNFISPQNFAVNASDFFLVSARVNRVLTTEYRERTRFLRGLVQTVGFRQSTLAFVAPRRAGGTTKYSLLRLLSLSISAMAVTSKLPLRAGLLLGGVFGLLSLGVGIYSLFMKFLVGQVISGYTTIVVLMSFIFSVQFIVLGVIGEYVGFLFDEAKGRPIYLVESVITGEGGGGEN